MKLCESLVMDLSMEQRLAVRFCFKSDKILTEFFQMVKTTYEAKQYSVRKFSGGLDGFVMDLKTVKTTPGVAGPQKVVLATMLGRFLSCSFKSVNFL
jgi:hypothetical protein